MIGEPKIIMCLMDKAVGGSFWGIQNGQVGLSANPYFLDYTPVGWQDTSVKNVRNKRYFGIDRSVGIGLQYVRDAAKILKHIIYTYGTEAPSVFLKIGSYTVDYDAVAGNVAPYYKQIFAGEIDLPGFAHDGAKLSVKTLESGLAKHLKANEKTLYEIPMDVPAAVWVKDDGINLLSKKTFSTINEGCGTQVSGIGNGSRTRLYYLTYLHIQAEGTNVNLIGQDVTLEPNGYAGITYSTSDQWFLEASAATTVSIDIKLPINYRSFAPNSATGHGRVMLVNNSGALVGTVWQNYHDGPAVDVQVANFQLNYTMAAGERLFLILELNIAKPSLDGNSYPVFFATKDSTHGYSYKNRYKPTFTRALRPQYVFNELINKVTGGLYQAAICPLLTEVQDRVLRSGDAIRGQEKPLLKISLDMFFEWLDCRNSVGMYIDAAGKVSVAKKADMVDYSSTIALSNPSNVQIALADDMAFNELQIGYPEFKNDVGALNGNNEFNTKMVFSAGALKSSRTLTKVSPVKASCYEQENIRVSLDGKNSTDNKADNDVFVVHIQSVLQPQDGTTPAHYLIDRSMNASITGVLEADTVYNVAESPRRNFERISGYLHSLFYKCDTLTFSFASADKNSAMVYTPLGGAAVPEKAPYNIGAFGNQFFTPMRATLTCTVPSDLLDRLDSNPLQALAFTLDGITYTGLPESIGYEPVTMKAQTVTMLLGPNNDFLKLIDYNGQ